MLNHAVAFGLVLLVVLSPLPLGSNREWSWSLCALVAGFLALLWVLGNSAGRRFVTGFPGFVIPSLAILACAWAALQQVTWTPLAWHHPLWVMTGEALDLPVSGRITLSAGDTRTALMRLLSYALVFMLAFQLGRDRERAEAIFRWLVIAGLVYALFGLLAYWGNYHPAWLFGDKLLPHDVRASFINRNHFATWQGLTLITAMAYFYQQMSRPIVKPYSVPQDREERAEEFVLRAWRPLVALLLMTAGLVLTHSRGGFTATLAATIVLLVLINQRGGSRGGYSKAIVVAALIGVSISFYLTAEVLLDRINRTDISSEERLAVFADVNRGIAGNPVLGYGYGTFSDSFRMYSRAEVAVHYDRAHNTWLENAFELGLPAASALYLCLLGLALTCLRGVFQRRRDWIYPAVGVAASVLAGVHATVDFSLQLPAVAILFACLVGVATAQSFSSRDRPEALELR